jgi:hypothetical protein
MERPSDCCEMVSSAGAHPSLGEAGYIQDVVRSTALPASAKVDKPLWRRLVDQASTMGSGSKRDVCEQHQISTVVRPGDSISSNTSGKSGSTTCLVTFASHPLSLFAITCAHVLDLQDLGSAVMSPSYRFGSLVYAIQGRPAPDWASLTIGSIATYCLGAFWHRLELAYPFRTPVAQLPNEQLAVRRATSSTSPEGSYDYVHMADWALVAVHNRVADVGPDWRKVAEGRQITVRGIQPGEDVRKLPSLVTRARVAGQVSAVPAAIQCLESAEVSFAFCVVSASQFSRPGDSGAPVVGADDGALVAVVTAGSTPSLDITVLQDAFLIEQQLQERGYWGMRVAGGE